MTFLSFYLPLLLLVVLVISSIMTGKLTLAAGITGGLLATLIFIGAGYTGIAMLSAFFILGTLTTSWKKELKQQHKAPGDQSVKRKTSQVLANGGVAAIAGALVILMPLHAELFRLMMAASLASATADTLSSELGMIYGKRFYNIITLKRDQKGLDGVISLEGTLIGVTGSVLIALICMVGFGWNNNFWLIIAAGTTGNLSDSVLGALLERKKHLTNDAVNFLNTLIAALFAGLCVTFF